jgi:hypothetical protein
VVVTDLRNLSGVEREAVRGVPDGQRHVELEAVPQPDLPVDRQVRDRGLRAFEQRARHTEERLVRLLEQHAFRVERPTRLRVLDAELEPRVALVADPHARLGDICQPHREHRAGPRRRM